MLRVLITGSTRWSDAETIRRELARLPAACTLIHGDCPGADELAGRIGRELGHAVEAYRKEAEDYRRYGQAAWKRLNERMLHSGIDLVLAFNTELQVPGKALGTRHMIELAQAKGVEVRTFPCA